MTTVHANAKTIAHTKRVAYTKRIVAAAGGVLIAAASGQAAAQKSPLGQAAYGRAQDALAGSRFADAARELETAVRYEPRFAFGWYLLASVSRRAGDCDRAVESYRRYMELRPADADPYFGAGLCLQAVGDRAGASDYFRRYIERDARPSSIAFVEEARKHLAELDHAAIAAAAPAPAPPPALVEARDLRDHGKIDEAVARYRAASTADPKAADPHVELGVLLVSVHRNREAAEELRAGVRLNPLAVTGWYNLGFALRETGQGDEAVKAYRRYITLKPKDPDPRYGLGRALASLKRDDEALTAFRAYVALEARPTEKRWVKKARAEIARIESGGKEAAEGDAAQDSTKDAAKETGKETAKDGKPRAAGPPAKTTATTGAKPTGSTSPPPPTAPPPPPPGGAAPSQSAAAVQPPPARQPGE